VAVIAAAASLGVVGCSKQKQAPEAPPPEVTVAEVIQRDVAITGELTGTLKGQADVEIRARVEGYLQSIDYDEGTVVKKGQRLFTIDDQPYRAKLAEAKGELARAESGLAKANLDVSRYTPLAKERAISQAELDNAVAAQRSARAQVAAARANVEGATLDVGYTRITAPIEGLAGQAQQKVGDLVGKGEPTLLTTVSSIDPIRASINIPEATYLKYASKIPGVGAPASQEHPGAELVLGDGSVYPERGYLALVDRAVDPQTGTIHAELAFKNPTKVLRPGLYGKVRYRAEKRDGALLVPQRAVNELQGQYSVVVVNAEGKAETRKAKMGPRVGNLWIVEEGVKPGEKVVVEGGLKVRDGMAVKAKVVPAEAPAAEGVAADGAAPAPASTGTGAGTGTGER
jgi:membrane fusion protein (multidrug efflux system)